MAMRSQVDVSIIMTVYNHEKYVGKAIESVLEQETKYSFELLIGEDCSPDGSRTIVKQYEKAFPDIVRAFYRERNMGATKNVYELFSAANGRYIAILEGDDHWCDIKKLQRQIEYLENHTNTIGVACNYNKIDENDNIIEQRCILDENLGSDFTWDDFLKKMFMFQFGTLVFRNIFLEDKDFSIIYKAHDIVADLTVLTILLNRGNIFVMPEIMSSYREVIKLGGTNARSISFSDRGLSTYKEIRQLDLLRPFLKNPKDWNKRISSKKADYLIKLLKQKKGYSFSQWKSIRKMGDYQTNIVAVMMIVRHISEKIMRRN